MRNPELTKLYGKSLRCGLPRYGPPGRGKPFIARAVAGELGASFGSVGIAEVLNMHIGQSERNLAEVFAQARRKAPCVLFFDEVDALGQRRTQTNSGEMRAPPRARTACPACDRRRAPGPVPAPRPPAPA